MEEGSKQEDEMRSTVLVIQVDLNNREAAGAGF
jgi:hypothetical protein